MKLLISVIDPSECAAFPPWPDYLDVKNPADGSLGMPKPEVVRRIRDFAGDGVVISAAIGDATDDSKLYSERAVAVAKEGADIIKVGLLTFPSKNSTVNFLMDVDCSLRSAGFQKKIVAALYADRVDKEFLREFPELLKKTGAWGCLIDTYDKTRGRLLTHLEFETLKTFTDTCRENGVVSALAGGLQIEDLEWLNEVAPDIAGFRSAVVANGRASVGLSPEKLKTLFSRFRLKSTHRMRGFNL